MAFNFEKIVKRKFSSPQEMFRENKKKKVSGVLDYQSKMIDAYLEKQEKPDIALELPTGSGKTLIGLLIAEFRRNNFNELVAYLCPTRQLAKQVYEQAIEKYGLDPVLFIGNQGEFNAGDVTRFKTSKAIAITTYSAIFNTNSFFKDAADVLIFDDAHSAENYIGSFWSLDIDREKHPDLYFQLIELFSGSLSEQVYQKLTIPEHTIYDLFWFDKLPYPDFLEKFSDAYAILNSYCPNQNDLKFNWIAIESILNCCYVYLSSSRIFIRPIIPPSLHHPAFRNAKKRVYMSATLGLSGELERITGVSRIERLPLLDEWKKQTIGRRFFLFPELRATEEEAMNHLVEILKLVDRALVLAPNERAAGDLQSTVRKAGFEIIDKKEFEASKKSFVEKKKVAAVLANRFDGIDLPHEECRLLVISDLPKATNLQEKFLIAKMCASILFHERIRTRVTQAIGRCTRGANDYSAVYVLGNELRDELLMDKKQQYYHPEIQAELIFGQQQSEKDDLQELTDNFKSFLDFTGEQWQKAESLIYEYRDNCTLKEDNTFSLLMGSAPHEVNFLYSFLGKKYAKAVEDGEKALTYLNGKEVQGYRAFWYYNLGNVAFAAALDGHSEYVPIYKKYFRLADEAATTIDWLSRLSKFRDETAPVHPNLSYIQSQAERIERALLRIGLSSAKKFEDKVGSILALISSNESSDVENAHQALGELLGFVSEKSTDSSAPDPWWVCEDQCLVSEIKLKDVLGAVDVRQAAKHPDWMKSKTAHSKCMFTITVLTTATLAEPDALIFSDQLYYLSIEEYKAFALKYFALLRQLKNTLREEGDLEWRANAVKALRDEGFDFTAIKAKFSANELRTSVSSPAKKKIDK